MSWTDIPTILVQIGAKPFASTIRALRDNIPALANGDPGAPRVSPKAWGQTPLAGSAVGTVTLAGFSGYGGADVDIHYSNIAASAPMTLALSDDGVTFSSAATIAAVGVSGSASLFVDFETGDIESAWHDSSGGAGLQSVTAGLPSGTVSHIQIVAAGTSTTTIAVLARVNAGTVA